jgi:hypothetical protein
MRILKGTRREKTTAQVLNKPTRNKAIGDITVTGQTLSIKMQTKFHTKSIMAPKANN